MTEPPEGDAEPATRSMTDALALVALHAHARPINGGGSASGWTRVKTPPSERAGDSIGTWKVNPCSSSIEVVEFKG
jgi:hypothetical protein